MDADKIVGALGCCGNTDTKKPDCKHCPLLHTRMCVKVMLDGAADIIGQQQADLAAANARNAELETENKRLATPFAENNLMDLVRVNHDVFRSLKFREAEIAVLKAKADALTKDNNNLAQHGGRYMSIAEQRYELYSHALDTLDKVKDENIRLKTELDSKTAQMQEAMELLNTAINCLKSADNCNGCKYAIEGEPCSCDICDDMDGETCNEECPWWGNPCALCSGNDSWEWQHADRYDTLKAGMEEKQ